VGDKGEIECADNKQQHKLVLSFFQLSSSRFAKRIVFRDLASALFPKYSQAKDAQGQTNRLFQFVLDEVGHVHGHSLNRSIVVLFNVTKHAPILLRHEVNSHTFTTKSSTTTNSN
jgi:hypothetical protein